MAKIVIIDDEAAVLGLMTKLCDRLGHETHPFQTGQQGMRYIEQNPQIDLLIVDLRIGDMDGLQIIQRCNVEYPDMAVVMVTGYGSVETAVDAMKFGAFDYLTKPFEVDDLQRTVNRAVSSGGNAKPGGSPTYSPVESSVAPTTTIVGESEEITGILNLVKRIADNNSPALIEGEFGSGKQLISRAIHNTSRRNAAPFKTLQCSALPEDLLEQELFGSTGRSSQTIFERAQGGTVVLEEINMLPLRLQSQLDSFLEDMANRRIQGVLPAHLDVRFIASTNEKLEDWVKDGRFREDLFYRVSVIPINMPPLRRRKGDIVLLANHFLDNYGKFAKTPRKEMDKYAIKLLESYSWPGNVDELQNAIERAHNFAEGDRIKPSDLPSKITQKVEITDEDAENMKIQLPIGSKLSDYIKKQEKIFIRETLKYNQGSREKTASMLGVSIATLYRKMGLKLEREQMMN